ncbi:UNKNOWN [Stylonychia lemnae]|uniref:Uncharacterized protein n=1 Tax=Stylonychia lemnae TaxID=5949 RepID=A0A078AQ33_STYLE|nr:UNKNOWN [Stylonychia lemnae]|eukprot:CDW84279.1 UNKNOWN [Stylonychia lemnae]
MVTEKENHNIIWSLEHKQLNSKHIKSYQNQLQQIKQLISNRFSINIYRFSSQQDYSQGCRFIIYKYYFKLKFDPKKGEQCTFKTKLDSESQFSGGNYSLIAEIRVFPSNQTRKVQISNQNRLALTKYDFLSSKVAFTSSKNTNHVLVVDDIIPIKVSTPKLRLSKKKREALELYQNKELTDQNHFNSFYENQLIKSDTQLPKLGEDISRNSLKSSLSIFKNRETYQTIENPESQQPLLSQYFEQKDKLTQKQCKPKNRYHPPAQSQTFGQYQLIRKSRAQDIGPSKEEQSRQSALKELKDSRLTERMIETHKLRNNIIQKIRARSELNQFNNSTDKHLNGSAEKQNKEAQWFKSIQEQVKEETEQANREIFKQTMYDQRRAERLNDRVMKKYNAYWQAFNTAKNYDAKQYSVVQLLQMEQQQRPKAKMIPTAPVDVEDNKFAFVRTSLQRSGGGRHSRSKNSNHYLSVPN